MAQSVGDKASAAYANRRLPQLAGTVTVNVTTAGTAAFSDVSFAADAFPNGVASVQVSCNTSAPKDTLASYLNPTPTGVRIFAVRPSVGPVVVSWLATGNLE